MRFLLILAVWGMLAQSQPPPPAPSETVQEKQQASDSVKSNPDFLEQVTVLLKKQNEDAERQRQKDGQKSSSDWWLVGFTGALTFVGIVQLVAMFRQADYMRRTLPVTINAAKSARFSARAAYRGVKHAQRATAVTERANVMLESVIGITTDETHKYLRDDTVILVTLKNFGRTVAHEVKLHGSFIYRGKGGEIIEPLKEKSGTSIAPQGVNVWHTRSFHYWLDQEKIELVNLQAASLEYKLFAEYGDTFKKNAYTYTVEGEYVAALKKFMITSSTSD